MHVRRNPFASGCCVGEKPVSTTAGVSDASAWEEGGAKRAGMQAAGAAIVTGLAGGNAIGGAAGAGIASIAAGKLNELSGAIAGSNPTGNASANQALGNIIANAIATGAGGAAGGNAGAVAGYDVDRFNRQLHPDEKTLAKQLADKAKADGVKNKDGSPVTAAQIEDQMRIMGGSFDGTRESGAPATLIGQTPTDSGARWIAAPATSDGKTVLTQITAQPDQTLQTYIATNAGAVPAGDVPGIVYDSTGKGSGTRMTGPFTKFDKSDGDFVRNTTADAAGMVSTNAGRYGAATAALAEIPSPFSPGLTGAATTATVVGIAADALSQLVKPDAGQYVTAGGVSIVAGAASEKYPMFSPAINETANAVNNSGAAQMVQDTLNNYWQRVIDSLSGTKTKNAKN